jgi:hypothetical protein
MATDSGNKRLLSPVLRLALLLGVFVHLVGFLLFRMLSNELPMPPEKDPFVAYVPLDEEGGDLDLVEQAALFDSAPLFIPGRWSAASSALPPPESFGLRVFPDFEPEMTLVEDLRPQRIEFQSRSGVEEPIDLLEFQHWQLFRNFSLGDVPTVALEDWTPVAEVRVVTGENGRTAEVLLLDLPGDLALELNGVSGPPLFSVSMAASGILLNDAILIESSGSPILDAYAREWLRDPQTLARLPAGLLEIRLFFSGGF